MTQAISLHIGLNHVDPSAYQGWSGQLSGCINDAKAMQAIADSCGFSSSLLLDEQATSQAVIQALGQAAQQLQSGGTLLVTYSGHGGQVPDVNGDEDDGQDETWVLFDRMLIDDELYQQWSQLSAGVRVFVLSDSCHSGTVIKDRLYSQLSQLDALSGYSRSRGGPPVFRAIPINVQEATYHAHQAMYDTLQWSHLRGKRATVDASVILISGCLDNQLSSDGDTNGLFTENLLKVWQNGAFTGNYKAFWKAILAQMPATQSPNYLTVGADNPAFEAERPFTVLQGGNQGGGSGGSAPSIQGPAQLSASDPAPTFQVNAGPGRFYIVEVTSQPSLFDISGHGSERNQDNFYGSWSDTAHLQSASYTLPDRPWQCLKGAARLYYRIGTTSSATGWDDYQVSTPDTQGEQAPSIEITSVGGDQGGGTGAGTSGDAPSVTGPASLSASDPAPTFQVNAGVGRFYVFEITSEPALFDISGHGSERSGENFYGSWSDTGHLSGASYTLPDAVWQQLHSAARLYYRIGTTTSATGWDDYQVSTPDTQGDSAPSIELQATDRPMPAGPALAAH